jgi:two-component system nitrate/nitrite response regulator NarL
MTKKTVLLVEDISEVTDGDLLTADGVLLCSLDEAQLGQACRLICRGERIYPKGLLNRAIEVASPGDGVYQQKAQWRLSPRECELAQWLRQGGSNKEIARELGITEATVKVHLKSMLRKLGLVNRTQVAMWAMVNLNDVILPEEIRLG